MVYFIPLEYTDLYREMHATQYRLNLVPKHGFSAVLQ